MSRKDYPMTANGGGVMTNYDAKCPTCKREYFFDFIGTGKLRETLSSEKRNAYKPHCDYCQHTDSIGRS